MTNAPIIFENPLRYLHDFLNRRDYSKIFVLVDENTSQHCLPLLLEHLPDFSLQRIEILAGEEFKTIETVCRVWDFLSKSKADRNALLINLGGGMVTDLGGFVASTFKRGIDFINIPTTLLAMVDASAGGKNGVDFDGLKNQVGTFTQPEMVLIEPSFLFTLDQRQLLSGLAEMLKHGLIADAHHWNNLIRLEVYNAETLKKHIRDSVEIKLKIVEEDPHEKGLRKILNFGHTVGHAIESEFLQSSNALLHGEAIVIGMMIEAVMSCQQNLISDEELKLILDGFAKIYSHQTVLREEDIPKFLRWMQHDKKNRLHELRFSLLQKIGEACFDVKADENMLRKAITAYNAYVAPNHLH
ncbi:3-dehydroquinate synthase [Vaginella massiliensis]|uniref:3-dehydroquinate synthase n=1 Tax=Vaginella massiliensis TaxID=1816680 RepID=UPI000ABE0CBD|nr:3-dehydroquinate synthase [Vaginella massiliensis]